MMIHNDTLCQEFVIYEVQMTSLCDKFGNYTSRVQDLLEKIFLEFFVFLNFTFLQIWITLKSD